VASHIREKQGRQLHLLLWRPHDPPIRLDPTRISSLSFQTVRTYRCFVGE
jgi:hypothetical protein